MSAGGSDTNEIIHLFEQTEKICQEETESHLKTERFSEHFNVLFHLDPLDSTTWNALGVIYMMTDRLSDSEQAIRYSLELDSGNYWTWRLWAKILNYSGDVREAENAFRMAYELNPSDIESLYNLTRLVMLRDAYSQALDYLFSLIELDCSNQTYWDMITLCLRDRDITCLVCELDSVLCNS